MTADEPGDGPLVQLLDRFDGARRDFSYGLGVAERGRVASVASGVVRFAGLESVGFEELVRFRPRRGGESALGLVLDLDEDVAGAVVLGSEDRVESGDGVMLTGRVMDVPVGEALLGRVVDAAGRPLDGRGRLGNQERRPIERRPPEIMDRAPVEVPLQTGIKAIDALVPIGRGQRELIVGDRQTGKTTIAIDTILNQRDTGVVCVYCAVGQQTSSVAKALARLRDSGAIENSVVVVATGEDSVGARYVAPYSATTIAEYFMDRGDDVLIVYDDLTRHARAYRELSLLLRRPPGREAFPGDIFYVHSRLLERAAHVGSEQGGGSMTALPVIETQEENLATYIPTNLVSITDGQVYLSPVLFRRGQLPAVDVGRSVSRVGGRAQLPAYRSVGGSLRLSYSQFEELERFTRYGARLEKERQQELERGRLVRAALEQSASDTRTVMEQLALLVAVTDGVFDGLDPDRLADAERVIRDRIGRLDDVEEVLLEGGQLGEEERSAIHELAEAARSEVQPREGSNGAAG